MRLLPVLLPFFFLSSFATAAERTIVLTDVDADVHHEQILISSKDVGALGEWSVRKKTLRGGKQEGVDMITIDNGAMQIVVLPTRGMGIYEVKKGDIRLGWDSPVEEIVHPNLIDLESRGGLGWLEGFNEWMVRCGLEFAGHPGKDGDADMTLHGKIQNIPAKKVEVFWDGNRVGVRGVVLEKFFYGPKLALTAEVSTASGSSSFQISDTIKNHGAYEQEFQIIYHGNYGSSILEEGAVAVVPAKTITPMTDNAAEAIDQYHVYKGPTPGFSEEVYLVEPFADKDGNTTVLLHDKAGKLGTTVSWNVKELPYFTQWKNTPPEAEGYVTGLEPATGYPFTRRVERHYDRVPKLAPGASRTFTLDFGIQEGAEAVAKAKRQIESIIDGRESKVVKTPPEIPEEE